MISLVGVLSLLENPRLNIEMLDAEVCIHIVTAVTCMSNRGVTQTISRHYDTQWSCFCYSDAVTKYVQYMQTPSVEGIRNF